MDIEPRTLILVAGVIIAVLGVGFALTGGKGEKAAKRAKSLSGNARVAKAKTDSQSQQKDRRKHVQDSLKKIEEKQKELKKKGKLSLDQQLEQAGFDITIRDFYMVSGIVALIMIGIGIISGQSPMIIGAMGVVGMFGLPRWFLGLLKNRRERAFSEEFANALEVIVRGVKAGLPLNECLKVIGRESPDPVGKEFREMIDGIAMGVSLEEALQKMGERMPIAEVNFFVIVLSIQAKSGGNLSEALGNLASVLRDRKMMRAKIQAMSSEAKASAMIIGSLPFCVCALVYLTSPDYISLLFKERLGHFMVLGGLTWMTMGVLVMKKMINFKF